MMRMETDPRSFSAVNQPGSRVFKALRALAQEQAEFARELERFALGKARSGAASPWTTADVNRRTATESADAKDGEIFAISSSDRHRSMFC